VTAFPDHFFPFDETKDDHLNFQGLGASSLEDGELVTVFHDGEDWQIVTKYGFAGATGPSLNGWEPAFCQSRLCADFLQVRRRLLAWPKDLVYHFELVSPAFGRAAGYADARLMVLSICRDGEELPFEEMASIACRLGRVFMPNWFFPNSWPEVRAIADSWFRVAGPYRGMVLREAETNRRYVLYREEYQALQPLLAYATADRLPPDLVAAAALAGDIELFVSRLPKHAVQIQEASAKVSEWRLHLTELWQKARLVIPAKEFNDLVKDSPVSIVLFQLRRQVHPDLQTESVLETFWQAHRSKLRARLAQELA
jgi:hypothetical protein